MKTLISLLFITQITFNFSQENQPSVLQYTLHSTIFHNAREFCVSIPKDFKATDTLPVVYLFDAQWDEFYAFTHTTINYLTEIKHFPKCILVGIKSVNRQYELTPSPVNEDWKMPELGGAKQLEDHLKTEIIPFIDSLFHPSAYRIAIGHSLGGTFIINSLVDSPELFNACITASPNLQLDEEEITLKIKRNMESISQTDKFVFTAAGNEGQPDEMFLPYVKRLDAVFRKKRSKTFHWHFKIYEGMNHATIPLETIYQGLLLLAQEM